MEQGIMSPCWSVCKSCPGCAHLPVDEVVLLQVLTPTSNVTGHVEQVQHGKGGGLILPKDKGHTWVKSRNMV